MVQMSGSLCKNLNSRYFVRKRTKRRNWAYQVQIYKNQLSSIRACSPLEKQRCEEIKRHEGLLVITVFKRLNCPTGRKKSQHSFLKHSEPGVLSTSLQHDRWVLLKQEEPHPPPSSSWDVGRVWARFGLLESSGGSLVLTAAAELSCLLPGFGTQSYRGLFLLELRYA